jgi:hypothetical protein
MLFVQYILFSVQVVNMGLNRLTENPWLSRILLIVSLATTGVVLFLYSRIDSLVNETLYNYSLQFSSKWYSPYQSTTQLINVCLGAVLVLNAVTIGLSLFKKTSKGSENISSVEHNNLKVQNPKQQESTINEKTLDKPTTTTNSNICMNCDKTFTRPLVTLNFVNGKPKMMNTCPYCNSPIENVNNEKTSENDA